MTYGCIGEKLSHSFSKEIHGMLAPYDYELCELAPMELAPFIAGRQYRALNVTMPYKESILPMLDELDELAKKIGAVNTVVNRKGRLYGYNTDFFGLRALMGHAGISLAGKKVAILGTGGTSKTALAVCDSLDAREILRVSRTPDKGVIDYGTLCQKHTDVEILINTTPVGMYPNVGEACVSLDVFPRLSGVIDAVYNPLRTRLILSARERDIPAAGGLYMLVAQAVRASELFLDCSYPAYTAEKVYKKVLRATENIVLIGMPSSGKSTVGAAVARALGRPFYDTDALFAERVGKTAGEYIATFGEDAFRAAESEIVRELAPLSSAVIATGGGTILKNENVNNLLHNGRIYLIDRPPEVLSPTSSRPLSADSMSMHRLYKERFPLYRRAADAVLSGAHTAEEFSQMILEDFLK